MLATAADAPLESPGLVYEPKYDGIRAIVAVGPSSPARLWSRLGNEKSAQFPEVIQSLNAWASRLDRDVLLDGEIVALDDDGEPTGFQNLQGRIHLKSGPQPAPRRAASKGVKAASTSGATSSRAPSSASEIDGVPVALIVFDLLRDGGDDLRPLPLRERRTRLEALWRGVRDRRLRISEQASGDGRELQSRAETLGWEGLIAKSADSAYKSGRRSPDWRKLKLVRHQTCVVGGWTEPRGSRPFFGALLLGVHDEAGALRYVGHSGAGFSDAELGRVWKKLQSLKTKVCPFSPVPKTNERPFWVKPQLVVEVKFTEWTTDGKLRHPTYLGVRDDVKPASVTKEPDAIRRERTTAGRTAPAPKVTVVARSRATRAVAAERTAKDAVSKATVEAVLDQLDAIRDRGGNGTLELPGDQRLDVTNLGKVFWPALKLTKGDLIRHYVRVAPVILPVLADRPLVLKRYPNGVDAKPFYQHRAPGTLAAGVRVEMVETEAERRPHFIGGSLLTLLYTAQLASISQDPWFSRTGSLDTIDHVAIDLDPPDGLPFARVLDVARWVREELDGLKIVGFPKTSGSGGLHVYVPMPPGTSYDAGVLFCQIVATMVANRHPKLATVERAVAARGKRIYVDFLQNIKGKTLASAYSPRANDFAGVSTPLTWDEVDAGVTPQDFTIRNFAARLASVGDLWAGVRKSKGADLRAVAKYAGR